MPLKQFPLEHSTINLNALNENFFPTFCIFNEFQNFLRLTSQLYIFAYFFLFDLYTCPKSVIKLNKVQTFLLAREKKKKVQKFYYSEILLIEVQTTTSKTAISDL